MSDQTPRASSEHSEDSTESTKPRLVDDDRIDTPLIDITRLREKNLAVEHRLQRLEGVTERQTNRIEQTHTAVLELSGTVRDALRQTERTAEDLVACRRENVTEPRRRRIAWTVAGISLIVVPLLGVLYWAGNMHTAQAAEREARLEADKVLRAEVSKRPTKEALEARLPSKANLKRFNEVVEELDRRAKAPDDVTWFYALPRGERRRFCRRYPENERGNLPRRINAACEHYRWR